MSIWDYEELGRHLCCIPDDDEESDIDDACIDKFGVGFVQFVKIVEALMPLAMSGKSPLTGHIYQGFANGDLWLAKRPVQGVTTRAEAGAD